MSDWRSLLDRGDGWRGRSEPINITPVDIAILLSMKEHFLHAIFFFPSKYSK